MKEFSGFWSFFAVKDVCKVDKFTKIECDVKIGNESGTNRTDAFYSKLESILIIDSEC